MTHKEISQFKFDVSSELHQFAYDFEQQQENYTTLIIFGTSFIQFTINSNNSNDYKLLFIFSIDTDCNQTGNYLEFSKKFKAFKQQAEKLL